MGVQIEPAWVGTLLGSMGVGAAWSAKWLFGEIKKKKSRVETDYNMKPVFVQPQIDAVLAEFMSAQREDRREHREILKEFVGEFRAVSKSLQEVMCSVKENTNEMGALHEDLKERIQRIERNMEKE